MKQLSCNFQLTSKSYYLCFVSVGVNGKCSLLVLFSILRGKGYFVFEINDGSFSLLQIVTSRLPSMAENNSPKLATKLK